MSSNPAMVSGLRRQLTFEEAARLAEEEEYADPGRAQFNKLKDEARLLPKKNLKKHLEKRGLSTKGSHDVMLTRLLKAIDPIPRRNN